jgi:hypothetical protein
VIPISVQPVDPSRPVLVVLKLDYAVCEKICIPAKGEASLWLEPGVTTVTSPARKLRGARAGPSQARRPQGEDRDRRGRSRRQRGRPGPAPDPAAADGGRIEDIFVEGSGMWSFGKSA